MKNKVITITICILALGIFLISYEGTTKNSHEEQPQTYTIYTAIKYNKKNKKKKTTKKKTTKKKSKKKYYSLNIKYNKQAVKNYAYEQVVARWGADNWNALEKLIQRESGWNPNSVNRSSGACGLFQFYPCSRGGSAYRTSYKSQITQGLDYIQSKYGSPKKAWKFWQKHHWY